VNYLKALSYQACRYRGALQAGNFFKKALIEKLGILAKAETHLTRIAVSNVIECSEWVKLRCYVAMVFAADFLECL